MGRPRLDATAAARYQENGYHLFREPVLSPDKFAALTALFEEMVAANPGRRTDTFDTPHFHEPRLLPFLLDDAVIDLVEPLIGPNIGLWSSHFISKEPGIGRRTPWHTDADYWAGRFDRYDSIVTVWLAIDASDRENGCMKVIPGSHRSATNAYADVDAEANLFPTEIRPEDVREEDAVYFELAPNQCSLHDSRIIHGAEANTSARRRCGYTMRYFDMSMRVIPEVNPDHKLWLCRGENVAGNPIENG